MLAIKTNGRFGFDSPSLTARTIPISTAERVMKASRPECQHIVSRIVPRTKVMLPVRFAACRSVAYAVRLFSQDKPAEAETDPLVDSLDACFSGMDRGVSMAQVVLDTDARFSSALPRPQQPEMDRFHALAQSCCLMTSARVV